MFYEYDKRDKTRLPHDPFKAIVAPRPIGWVTSISLKGEVNLAPYSYFNGVNSRPNLVMFASEGAQGFGHLHRRDPRIRLQSRHLGSARANECSPRRRCRAESTKWSAPGWRRRPRVWSSRRASRPRPCALECKLIKIVAMETADGAPVDCHVVFGQVVGVHIDDRFIVDGRSRHRGDEADRPLRLRPVCRGRERVFDDTAERLARTSEPSRAPHLTLM